MAKKQNKKSKSIEESLWDSANKETYGAELIFRERMIIGPQSAIKLVKKHLKLNLKK